MRNLIICCDGTWNAKKSDSSLGGEPTNVVRIKAAVSEVSESGTKQLAYYHPGVGTEGNRARRLWSGLTGAGLDRNIMSAYKWLGAHYQTGDRIFLFGFSRGAYTVRSLGGMLSQCGLLDLTGLEVQEIWRRVGIAYHEGYRGNKSWPQWALAWNFHGPNPGKNTIPIHFIGVWDTVGSLGIPDELGILGVLQGFTKRRFHDTKLGEGVQHARHALAIDEMRSTFVPTLWTNLDPDRDVKQLWFPGVHADIGGGYLDHALTDITLEWMMQEASACGLGIRSSAWNSLHPDAQGRMHDSYVGVFKALKNHPRSVPALTDATHMHESAQNRHQSPPLSSFPYHETFRLSVGGSETVSVFANEQWNETGIYLESGATYQFEAEGQWQDKNISCGPAGTRDGHFHPSETFHWFGSGMGMLERVFRRSFDNQKADFWWSRRDEEHPWFSLVGVLANGKGPAYGATHRDHAVIGIGSGCLYPEPGEVISESGYLWCFANDAWTHYQNNRGSVRLTVTRLT